MDPMKRIKPMIGIHHPIAYHPAEYFSYGLSMSSLRIPMNMKYKAAGLTNLIRKLQ